MYLSELLLQLAALLLLPSEVCRGNFVFALALFAEQILAVHDLSQFVHSLNFQQLFLLQLSLQSV